MIVINDTLGAYGGGQTLMLRICTWLNSQHIKAVLLCDNADNTEIVKALLDVDADIRVISIYDFKKLGNEIRELLSQEEIKVINFAWNQYLSIEIVKKENGFQFDNFIYCIHPQTFMKGNGIGLPVLQSHIKNEYAGILERVNENGALLMMDEITWNITEEYFGKTIRVKQPIIRIPIFIEELADKDQIIRDGFENEIIFTSARAEFPFKGYMIGLIDVFKEVKQNHKETKLVIVSGGNDYGQLEEKIASMPDEIKESIELHGWMNQSDLIALMKKSKLVIGMGTTLLDASRNYKPCIPVCTYTMECKTDGFFDEKPENINAITGDKSVAELISQTLNLTFEEYRCKAEKTFEAASNTYDINKNMELLLSCETGNKGCVLKSSEIAEHKLANIVRKVRYRGKREFDYKRIKKEEGHSA